ncbi:MAG: Plug domain-containing protein, partial [Desulfobacteraceae bacterium]|nr:Plug domain-containing protein [Desulfobacteraceae bacterium]
MFKLRVVIVCVVLLMLGSPAWASEPSKVLMMDEITVQGKAINVSPPPPSATIITGEELQDEYFENTQSVLDKIPGAVVREYGQGGVASSFVMRGLQLGHNTGAAFFVDGVPLNESTSHGDGYADVNSIIPEDIDYIEIIKGPSSALYGQFA